MITGVGVDATDIARFARFRRNSRDRFLERVFTPRERRYCFGQADPKKHLAGTFSCKEAVAKAMDASTVILSDIEIRRARSGAPQAWRNGRRLRSVRISISHTDTIAVAIAVIS